MLRDSTATPDQPKPLAVDCPTRGADRNQDIISKNDPRDGDYLLPSLEDGITLLDITGGRGVEVLQALVLDHLLCHDGPAFWVNANGYATTTSMAKIAPSQRLLDRIHVARGFTAYQHYGAICDLPRAVNRSIQQVVTDTDGQVQSGCGESPYLPSLIVVPAIDSKYRDDDTLSGRQADTLQARTLARLVAYADSYEIPVLVTRTKIDAFTVPIATAADHHLECEQTQMGPRFVGEEFETFVYPVDHGYSQTTFAYWRHILKARAARQGVEPATPTTPQDTTEAGVGIPATGEPALTADPLLDAWASTGGR